MSPQPQEDRHDKPPLATQQNAEEEQGQVDLSVQDYWTISADLLSKHHLQPRTKLFMPDESPCPLPMQYIDVYRTTETNLDSLSETRVDDIWFVDTDKELSAPWVGKNKNLTLTTKTRQEQNMG